MFKFQRFTPHHLNLNLVIFSLAYLPPILFLIIYCTIQVWHDASEYVNRVHDNKLENGATGVELNAVCACLCHTSWFWNL